MSNLYKLETKSDILSSAAENLKETLKQIGHKVKNVSEKLGSLGESSQDEGQYLWR